jgi:hypothetical protein
MELLDDNLDPNIPLSKEDIKEVYKLRQEHSKAKKAINNARIALTIICVFSIFSLFGLFSTTDDALIIGLTLGVILIYVICAAVEPKYAKWSLTIAFGLYAINILASFFTNPIYAILGLIVKSFFIYFIVVGMIAAYKFTDILKKMDQLKIIPYKY